MHTLPNHFSDLRSNIEPDEDRRELAKKLPSHIRDFLKNSDVIVTIDPHSRLAGSYARHTAINHIKDVDILLIVDSSYKSEATIEEVLGKVFTALGKLPDYLLTLRSQTNRL
jgi:tRNA nucleotidyltransferase (CCA-adding enzyme)